MERELRGAETARIRKRSCVAALAARWLADTATGGPRPKKVRMLALRSPCPRLRKSNLVSEQFVGTMPVQERHRFDTGALERYLRERVEGFSGRLAIEQFKGGQSNP